jgi:hypothetical protein
MTTQEIEKLQADMTRFLNENGTTECTCIVGLKSYDRISFRAGDNQAAGHESSILDSLHNQSNEHRIAALERQKAALDAEIASLK